MDEELVLLKLNCIFDGRDSLLLSKFKDDEDSLWIEVNDDTAINLSKGDALKLANAIFEQYI